MAKAAALRRYGLPRGRSLTPKAAVTLDLQARRALLSARPVLTRQHALGWEDLATQLYLAESRLARYFVPALADMGVYGILGPGHGPVAPIAAKPHKRDYAFLGGCVPVLEVLDLPVLVDADIGDDLRVVALRAMEVSA